MRKPDPCRRAALCLGALIAVWPATAVAADREIGRTIAETWCASCHTVSAKTAGNDTAPAFSTIANADGFSREAVRGVITAPHPPMPRLDLSRGHIEDLIEYIAGLRDVK